MKKISYHISKLIEIGWNLPILISGSLFILSIFAFFYGVFELLSHFLTNEPPKINLLLILISVLKDFLFSLVLYLLSVGIYEKIRETRNSTTSFSFNLQDIEKNFIGIIILTMLVVALGNFLTVASDKVYVLYISISIAVLTISAAVYMKFLNE